MSGNRKFTKYLVRFSCRIDDLRNSAKAINTNSLPFDTLQIVFLDRDQSYFRSKGCNRDRLFQVEVATPDEQNTDYSDAESLIRGLSEKLLLAVQNTTIPEEDKSRIAKAIQSAIIA